MMSTGRILLLSLAFLGIVGLLLWVAAVYQPTDNNKGGNGYKRLSGTVAEGFVYRVSREKHPRATCSACRVGKMKLGLISLGAFNTIEFDDLVINVPESTPTVSENNTSSKAIANTETDMVVDALNLKPIMSLARTEAKKFVGIKITKLQLNQISGDRLLPILKAGSLKSSGKRMIIYDAVLYKDGQKLPLREVELKVKPRFKLIWPTGMWDLTDMFRAVR